LFETSQELYVAAKSMKEYCEDSLERYETSGDLNSFEKIQEKEALVNQNQRNTYRHASIIIPI
jgi:hypothetical protein